MCYENAENYHQPIAVRIRLIRGLLLSKGFLGTGGAGVGDDDERDPSSTREDILSNVSSCSFAFKSIVAA